MSILNPISITECANTFKLVRPFLCVSRATLHPDMNKVNIYSVVNLLYSDS